MIKPFLFLFFSVFLSAQTIEKIELNDNLHDYSGLIKSVTLKDFRPTKDIGVVSHRGKPFHLQFSDENLAEYVESWFFKTNKKPGTKDEIVLVLEELEAKDELISDKKTIGVTRLKLSSFVKRNNKYHFIHRFWGVLEGDPKNTANVPKTLTKSIEKVFTELVKLSYKKGALRAFVTEEELQDYDKILTGKSAFANSEELKDGVYTEHQTFFSQEPLFGYKMIKNKKGKPLYAEYKKNVTVEKSKIYAFVENGVAFKSTAIGFKEVKKDEKGIFIEATHRELFPQSNDAVIFGAITGGIVGAVIGSLASSSGSKTDPKYTGEGKVYIDPLTGEYIFIN